MGRIGGISGEQTGERCPTGVQAATFVAYYDIGLQIGFEGKVQHKIALMWESQHKDTKGRSFTLFDVLTASSNEKATLTQRYACLAGRAATEQEMEDGYDLDPLIGKACFILVSPSKKPGGWPFIENVMPLPPGMPVAPSMWRDDGKVPPFVEVMRKKSVQGNHPAPAKASGATQGASRPAGGATAASQPSTAPAPAVSPNEALVDDAAFDKSIPF